MRTAVLVVLVEGPAATFALRASAAKEAGHYVREKGPPEGGPEDLLGRSERTGPTTRRYCFGSSILILSSGSILPSSAADPVGKLSLLKRNATMSAACSGVSVPGAVAGIVVCVFS